MTETTEAATLERRIALQGMGNSLIWDLADIGLSYTPDGLRVVDREKLRAAVESLPDRQSDD